MFGPRHAPWWGTMVGIALAAFWGGGCFSSPRSPEEPLPIVAPPIGKEDAGPVTVRVADENELAEAVRQHRGEVVLVDFWALWCLPCLKLFPHTVALHDRFADRGLAVISVSLDDPKQRPAVEAFLREQDAGFEHFISQYGTGSRSMEVFEIDGGVPHLKLYGRDGTLKKTFHSASIDPGEVDREVETLLGS